MSKVTRLRAAGLVAAAFYVHVGAVSAQAEVITVPGQTVTHTIPGTATPPIGPAAVGTPAITVPRTCAGAVFCAGPIEIPPQTIVSVPRINPVALTPTITLAASTTDIVAVVDPALTTLVTVPPTTIPVPNPFGGDPIPVDVCPTSCVVPGASVVDGATGSVTLTACVGATCETQTVPVQYGDTSPGQVCFTQATHQVGEGAGSVTLTVQRTGGSFNDAYVSYATQPGTALSPGDYGARSGQLHWAHGDNSPRAIAVPIVGDSTDEPDESFSVVLSGAVGATPCQPSAASVTILDDDNPPAGSLQFSSSSYQVDEDGVSVTIQVQRTGGTFGTAEGDVVFSYGSAGSTDFVNPGSVRVTFTGGTTSQPVTVLISDDAAYEGNETFQASLQNVSGASLGSPGSATVTIVDDDTSDDTPDPFSFPYRSDTVRNAYIISDGALITGITVQSLAVINSAASPTGGFDVNGSQTWLTSGYVNYGDTVRLRHLSSTNYTTTTSTQITIGQNPGQSATFSSTTRDPPEPPCDPICP